MRLYDIYKNQIDRDINGVIKVAQDDEKSIHQELTEYVITRELRRHFSTFLSNYEHSLDVPTDKMGVWISGFFGSGKSHFLKMLSYLLSNREVKGKSAIAYFEDKFDDPMMFAQLEHCVSVPTETILFNIDSKSPINKDATAILRVFAKVFYEHLGFYGHDLKVAKFEQFISKHGKLQEFRERFEEVNGDTWENARDAFAFWEDDIVDAICTTVGISETAARNWFNGEETAELTIEQLVAEIRDYVFSKGKDTRLLFMIDEVGQYIGSDGSLMLNLQTIVEEIGSKCGGRVWVMVTSQEAIDSITKISGDDFSKIQGRFNTRLSLSSSSVDEVIKKRILAKTEVAEQMLKLQYSRNSAVLRNLFTFNGAVLDMKGYEGENEFVETYPFVPYQFRLMQNVLAQIRKHGNSGKHLSGGERSMLSGFQEAAQVIADKDENALIPFSLFYNTVHTFLESTIRRVIDRCQRAADAGDGIEQYDVEILKLLYLIRYVDDLKANVDNIATLMADDIRSDKIIMRQQVQISLDRLLSQNYIARNGDTYAFLTDDEQDIAREIRQTVVNSADITQKIIEAVAGGIYDSKKFRYEKYDFPFDLLVDETAAGNLTGAMKLRLVTVASDLYGSAEQTLIMKSADNEAILVLSEEYPYFEEIESAMKIRKYVKGRNVAQLPETIQNIIRGRQQQAAAYEKRARELIAQAITGAKVYVHGERLADIKAGSAKDKIEKALTYLVESVYAKLSLVTQNYSSDQDILNLLDPQKQSMIEVVAMPNAEAMEEIDRYLQLQEAKHLPTTMGDVQRRFSAIPYGWREIDIAAVIAQMIAGQKVAIRYSGSVIQPADRRMPDYLRKRTEIDKTVVAKRRVMDANLIEKTRKFLRGYLNVMDIPGDEDGLIAFVLEKLTAQKDDYSALLQQYGDKKYPDKALVEDGIGLIDAVLQQRRDNTALLTKMLQMQDDLLDLSEDISDVVAFFKNQRPVFDKAAEVLSAMSRERSYLEADMSLMDVLRNIQTILVMPKPYRKIAELPTLVQQVYNAYAALMETKRTDVAAEIRSALAEIHSSAAPGQTEIVERADKALQDKKNRMENLPTLTELDALRIQIQNIQQQYLKMLTAPVDPQMDVVTVNRGSVCHAAKLKTPQEVETYTAMVREKLLSMLDGHDVIHII